MTFLIDSDWVIDYLAGRPAVIRLVNSLVDQGLAISLVTYAEAHEGIEGGRDPIAAEDTFRDFLIRVNVLPISLPVMLRFARCAQSCDSRAVHWNRSISSSRQPHSITTSPSSPATSATSSVSLG